MIYVLMGVLMAAILLIVTVLLRNAPAWTAAPGIAVRLTTYLRTHQANLVTDAVFSELEAPRLQMNAEQSSQRIRQTVKQLGWRVQEDRLPTGVLHAVAASPLLHFQDDIRVSIQGKGNASIISAESRSRIGQADFAANAGHLYLFKQLLIDPSLTTHRSD